jgi:hypothetical protein
MNSFFSIGTKTQREIQQSMLEVFLHSPDVPWKDFFSNVTFPFFDKEDQKINNYKCCQD